MPLVSIIIPCYNSADYIGRCLESILSQTHKNIEMICVNDGSTDRTEEAIISFDKRFQSEGMKLIYLPQAENRGQAAAVNQGLKRFAGEYLCWVDSDDFLAPESVEKRMRALEENPEYGAVMSDCYMVHEDDPATVLEVESDKYGDSLCLRQPWQFAPLLAGLVPLLSLMQMVRSEAFLSVNPGRTIFAGPDGRSAAIGQNYQLLLPVLYRFKRLFLDEPLAFCVARTASHFHAQKSLRQQLNRLDCTLEAIRETLVQMNLPEWERERYMRLSCFNSERARVIDELRGGS